MKTCASAISYSARSRVVFGKFWLIFCVALVGLSSSVLCAKYEQEQLQMETQMQQRIEGILARTFPPNSYLVTVKVEMENREQPVTHQTRSKRGGNNVFQQNQYVLPGVPQKKEFSPAPESTTETTVNAFSAETLVKRILITILVSPDISAEQIRAIRDVITTSLPFNPLRGDELDIQNSPLLKPASANGSSTGLSGSGSFGAGRSGGFLGTLSDKTNAPVMLLLGAFSMGLVLFVAFLFGPVRAFLDRLLAVLPRIGEQAAYTVSNAPSKTSVVGGPVAGSMAYGSNGNGSHGPGEEGTRPFRFIREDQLNKLPILFKAMSPAQCALVLAYLPAQWASNVLGTLDAGVQTAIMGELSQAREVPPEIVHDIEEQIKSKLPYLVGGVEWIQSVYQLTQPQTQRALLGTLNQQSPALAQALRRKTFFLEDLSVISAGSLRLVFQEASYPIVALALRDERPENRNEILKRLPVAMREILEQELEASVDDKQAILDAKNRLLDAGRRLLAEGRIALPERK
jgi:hypothetical protein